MDTKTLDPDLKINMSLDEIIHFTKPKSSSSRRLSKKNKKFREKPNLTSEDHSVPLFSKGGGFIMVTKSSPLINAENQRKITTSFNKRLQSIKEIIPAQYQFVKTTSGIEKILVPVDDTCLTNNESYILYNKTKNRQISSPFMSVSRKLSFKPQLLNQNSFLFDDSKTYETRKMEVDEDDEIQVLEVKKPKSKPLVVDIEAEEDYDPKEWKCISAQGSTAKTLHDRFTELSSSPRF